MAFFVLGCLKKLTDVIEPTFVLVKDSRCDCEFFQRVKFDALALLFYCDPTLKVTVNFLTLNCMIL